MKKHISILLLAISSFTLNAQEYNISKLETIARIWGECYLFHPSVIRADKSLNWEQQLVQFLPAIKQETSANQFAATINTGLLSALQDPLTAVQLRQKEQMEEYGNLQSCSTFDYMKITASSLSQFEVLSYIDSIAKKQPTSKPLVIDCRINSDPQPDWHAYTPFHYLMSMLIEEEMPLSQLLTRQHFGWDERNDWWLYEQQWKIAQVDMQQQGNGIIKPFKAYQHLLMRHLPNFDYNSFAPIKRPVYFILNKTLLSYYQPLLQSLQQFRDFTYIIFDTSGKIAEGNNGIKKHAHNNFDFYINTALHINNSQTGLFAEHAAESISQALLGNIVAQEKQQAGNKGQFSYQICPQMYGTAGAELTVEEKILGIIKIWTIIRYFYPYLNSCQTNWDAALGTYLKSAQQTTSNKEYYILVQQMMAMLNDSHVSTFHPSILDFSSIYVAPVQFKWIENKLIVTAIDSTLGADIEIGDEITAIDGQSIEAILHEAAKTVSSSNQQGLLATALNPGYFIGPMGSSMKLQIKKRSREKEIEVLRTKYIYQFAAYGSSRPAKKIHEGNIGYLNLAQFTQAAELEKELAKMQSTNALILDLRNSYPTADYQKFLQMLCQEKTAIRQSSVPIITAAAGKTWHCQENWLSPAAHFTYNKPICVLIDKTMISRPEDIAIALSAFPNVKFIGEQTQGTDGEATKIYLPGGGETAFTGQVVKFGNGEQFQGKGIHPHIKVEQTVQGIKNNKDEILEKAIEILQKEQ